MITLYWSNLRDGEFMNSMHKLYSQPLGYEYGMKLALLGKVIKSQQKLLQETHESILKKFGTLDTENVQKGVYKLNEATKDEYAKELEKLDAHSFEVKIGKLDASVLSEVVKFTAQDLMLLEPLLLPFAESTPVAAPSAQPVEASASH